MFRKEYRGKAKDPAGQEARDAANQLPRCNCGNLASACSGGECWTCAAKRHEAQR